MIVVAVCLLTVSMSRSCRAHNTNEMMTSNSVNELMWVLVSAAALLAMAIIVARRNRHAKRKPQEARPAVLARLDIHRYRIGGFGGMSRSPKWVETLTGCVGSQPVERGIPKKSPNKTVPPGRSIRRTSTTTPSIVCLIFDRVNLCMN